MDTEQIFEKLKLIIKSIKSDVNIRENTGLLNESILDSLEFMNYISKVEESFSLSISDSEISGHQLGIIKNMISFISTRNK